jgi:hypothetical protein
MEIKALAEKGVYQTDIAYELGVHPKTVSWALKQGGAPAGEKPNARRSMLGPFKSFIDELLKEGVWNGRVIFRELQSRQHSDYRGLHEAEQVLTGKQGNGPF